MRRKFIAFLKSKGVYDEYMERFKNSNPDVSFRKFCNRKTKGLWIVCAFPFESKKDTEWSIINREWAELNRKVAWGIPDYFWNN